MPQLTVVHRAGMHFCSEDGREALRAKRRRIHDWMVIEANEMIRQGNEIIPFVAVATTDLLRGQNAVRPVGMGVQVAAPKAAWGGEGKILHD